MKTFGSQLAVYLSDKEARRNVRALLRYITFVVFWMVLIAALFQLIMRYVEGQEHSLLSGLYWALVTMSTLGFGDIVFHTDVGRLFSMFTVLSGIVLLLVVLPYAFIRYFYAPWLEAQIHARAPRVMPETMRGHVIITSYDTIAPGLIERLEEDRIPYVLIEPDPTKASSYLADDISVLTGEVDSKNTYLGARAAQARMVFINSNDMMNTKIILTVREVAPHVPIATIAEKEDSVDILELSGANQVFLLKKRLGEQLAARVSAQHAQPHPIGRFKNLRLAELPVHHTPLVGRTIRQTRLRETTGVSIVGVWERGRLKAAHPDLTLTQHSVPVVVGTEEQLEELNSLFVIYDVNPNPVLVIGGGRVGSAVARVLKEKNIPVHIVERNEAICGRLGDLCDHVFHGDAADYDVLHEAGVDKAPSVVLSTHDDATNIYLASYCRRLNPDLRIVSRITHERNIESIHRAGADFVLSYDSLGMEVVYSLLRDQELIILGEGVDFFSVTLPEPLSGKTLKEAEIGAKTGLNVIAAQHNGVVTTDITANTRLKSDMELLMLGDVDQRQRFIQEYGQ